MNLPGWVTQLIVMLGLAGCAMALVALALDWRDEPANGWRYTTTRPLQ